MPEFFINPTRSLLIRVEATKEKCLDMGKCKRWLETRVCIVVKYDRRTVLIEQSLIDDEQFDLIREGYSECGEEKFNNFLKTECADFIKKMDL